MNPQPVAELLARLEERQGRPMASIALALPLSGPYTSVSWNILRGASTAQWEMAMNGTLIDIHVVGRHSGKIRRRTVDVRKDRHARGVRVWLSTRNQAVVRLG